MDQYKEYKYYMNEFNLENVLEDLDKKQGFIKSEKFKELFSKWIKYLMYPKEFLNKYKKKGDDIRENERQMRMSQLKNIAQKKTFS